MAKTGTLPTMENPKHPEIVRQANIYARKRDARIAAGREEKTEKDKLITLMIGAGLDKYFDADEELTVILENKKQSVKVVHGTGEDDE